jgi:hypothetical protein
MTNQSQPVPDQPTPEQACPGRKRQSVTRLCAGTFAPAFSIGYRGPDRQKAGATLPSPLRAGNLGILADSVCAAQYPDGIARS